MGSYISSINAGSDLQSTCPLIDLPLPKIREYHGGFKSVCDNFAINLTEFESIFNSNQQVFGMFSKGGLIDALEIFSGIIIFSDAESEDKIRFLFDLFDFNEIQTLSLMDIEFMMQSVLVCASKLFNVPQDINENELAELVRRNFKEGSRISLPQLLVWCAKTEEIKQFFFRFGLDGANLMSEKILTDNEFAIFQKHQDERKEGGFNDSKKTAFLAKTSAQLVSNKRANNFRAWLHTALQPIIAFRLEQITMNNYLKNPDEVKIRLEWVYGVRCQDTKRCLQYTVGKQYADSTGTRVKYERIMQDINEEVVYFVSNVVVLLNVKLNQQRFYTQHHQEIISLAVSNTTGDFIATGELSKSVRPQIHIWNSRTLDNINILQGIHLKGVHLLSFTSNDQFLVTCGAHTPSPIIIYDWVKGTVLLSTSIMSPTQEIIVLNGNTQEKKEEKTGGIQIPQKKFENEILDGFVIISLEKIMVFVYSAVKNEFKTSTISFEQAYNHTQSIPICSLSLIADYKNAFFQQGSGRDVIIENDDAQALDQQHSLKHILLTGHKDGKILIWRLQQFIGVLDDFGCEVSAMSKCFEGIAFATVNGEIFIWDTHLLKCNKTIKLTEMPFKILSTHVVNIDYNQKRLLVMTMNGDAIEVILAEAGSTKTIKAQRINTIVRNTGIENRALTILNQAEQTIMVGGDNGIVTSYDITTHELIDIWNVGQAITSLATLSLEEGGFVLAAGTDVGKIVIRQDWEEFIPRQHECGTKSIIDIKFSKNGQLIAAASVDKNIYLLKYHEGEYTALAACKLENGFPVSLSFSEDSMRIVITTNQRKLLVLDPTNFMLMYKPEDLSQCFWSSWQSKFPLITKTANTLMMPIVLGNQSNMVAAGDENGNLFFWKDVESIKENIGTNFVSHTSSVQKIDFTMDDNRLITLGLDDNCICQYKVQPIHYQENQVSLQRGLDEISQGQGLQKIILHPVEDETLILELNYCFQIQSRKTDNIADQTALVKGGTSKAVNKIHSKVGWESKGHDWQRPPPISLILENIYGVLLSDKRHTIMYMHFSNRQDKEKIDKARQKKLGLTQVAKIFGPSTEKKIDVMLPRILGNDYQTLLGQQEAIEYDSIHPSCSKNLVYYSSRFGVVYESGKRKQQFYSGHKLKISAIAKHPYLEIVATGEVNVNPLIHVWDAKTLETRVILPTSHSGGVLHLIFSTDGQKLISIGMDRSFSLQIFNWEQKCSLVFRNTGYYPIFGVRFNPYDDNIFYTCGYQHLAEWKINGSHLSCKKYLNVYGVSGGGKPDEAKKQANGQKCILLCMDFISYRLGYSVKSDIIFGNNLGDISTYCSQKYFVLHEQAHPGAAINAIRVTNTLSQDLESVMIITVGENGWIKIWNSNVELQQQIDMKQAVSIKDLKMTKSYGIQSVDVYACDLQKGDTQATIKVLVGMRCGDVFEVLFEFNNQYVSVANVLKSRSLTEEQKTEEVKRISVSYELSQKYIIKFLPIFSGHSSLQISHKQKKIISCIYPLYPVLASVGNDETLMIWDIDKNETIVSKNLGTQATCLDFSPDGNYLAIGLANGVFLLLSAKIEKLNFGTYMEEFQPPEMRVLMCPKESKSSIISIKFSYKGDLMVVSYNNEYHFQDLIIEAQGEEDNHITQMMAGKESPSKEKPPNRKNENREPSFVLIYRKKPGMNANSEEPFTKMQRVSIPLQDYSHPVHIKQKLAITKLDFSADDRYIEMAAQEIDKDNNINTVGIDDIFLIWDIENGAYENNYDAFVDTKWPDWSMGFNIMARYINDKFEHKTGEAEKQSYILENCLMTSIARFSLLDNAIMGSNFGEIFAFRFPAIYVDKSKVEQFDHEKIPKREMAISKGFDALTSMIESINIFEDRKVFVTGNNDQCILQYRVEYEDQDWELDFNHFIKDIDDPFGEIPNYPKFASLITEIWPQRLNLPEFHQNLDHEESKNPACELELEHIIGRRAYDRRNNVRIDCQERILYNASSVMVFMQDNMDPDAESFVHQHIMRPQDSKFSSTYPEVSCFELSEDKRLLYIGTSHVEGNLIVWEISTNLQLHKIVIHQMSIIYSIKVAYDNNHCVIIGVSPEYVLCLVILEIDTQTIIVEKLFLHSLPFKIKDLSFIPGYTRRLVTCGIQHMCFWKFNGQSLEQQVGELSVPKAFVSTGAGVYSHNSNNVGKFGLNLVCQDTEIINSVLKNKKQSKNSRINALDEELENIYVTFLCCGFIGETLITSGDDGYLYVWEGQRIVSRVQGHEGSIFALDCNQKLDFVCSGGIEGTVILWRLMNDSKTNIKQLEKLKVFNLRKELDAKTAVSNPEYNVQSVCIGFNRIVIGMRSGSILEVPMQEEGAKQGRQAVDKKSKIRKWMKCIDHETPISIAVDMVSQRIFSITHSGLFSVWDILTFDIIYTKEFGKVSRDIIAFKLTNKVLIVFENDIKVLDSNINNSYDELKEYDLKLNQISDAKLNMNERLLGVAASSSMTPEVSLYDTEGGFSKLSTYYGFKAQIKYIDFSTDNYYLQCEDMLGEVQLFEIESSRIINTETIEFDLEWLGEGLRAYSRIEGIRSQYTQDNKINCIVKISGKPIIAIGDEAGSIRLFNYPNTGSDVYYGCYTEHLHTVTKCMFTHDQRFLVSMSSSDRCVFKWRCKYNEKKVKNIMEIKKK